VLAAAQVEDALLAAGHPAVIATPGYVLHADYAQPRLYIKLPPGMQLTAAHAFPPGSLVLQPVGRTGVPEDSSKDQGKGGMSQGVRVLAFRMQLGSRQRRGAGRDSSGHTSGSIISSEAGAHQVENNGLPDSMTSPWAACASDPDDCPTHLGRIRLTLTFTRGAAAGSSTTVAAGQARQNTGRPSLQQHVQLNGVPSARSLVRLYGLVSSHPQMGYLPASAQDPWGRSPAFMG
jgi:hypothetical protein